MCKVTIAIPVYNAEKYIRETILSALAQTYDNLEILIIDDRGTDNSISIIEELQKNHIRGNIINIIHHKTNSGVAAARNTILKETTGDYLYFLDSDDLITPDCIETLFQNAKIINADVVYGSYQEKWENTTKELKQEHEYQLFTKENEFASFVYRNIYSAFRSFIWNILFKVSFLRKHNFFFEPVKVWEDLLFSADFIPYVKNAVILPNITYTYYRRENSLSQYNQRNIIPAEEILEHIRIRTIYKEKNVMFINKPYFDSLITKVMKICLDTASVILNKRKLISPPIPFSNIKRMLNHPLPLNRVLKMQQHKSINLFFFNLGVMPEVMSKPLIVLYTHIQNRHRSKK